MDISKPQGSWVHVEQVGDELVLRWRAKWFAAAGWFAFFLLVPAFYVFMIATAPREPTLDDTLYRILFPAMGIPGACNGSGGSSAPSACGSGRTAWTISHVPSSRFKSGTSRSGRSRASITA